MGEIDHCLMLKRMLETLLATNSCVSLDVETLQLHTPLLQILILIKEIVISPTLQHLVMPKIQKGSQKS